MPAYQSASIGALQMPWFASTARVRQSKLRCQFPAYADVHCYSTDFKIRCLGSLHQLGFCVPPSHATFADNNGITLPTSPLILSQNSTHHRRSSGVYLPLPSPLLPRLRHQRRLHLPMPNHLLPLRPTSKHHQHLTKHPPTPPLSPRNHRHRQRLDLPWLLHRHHDRPRAHQPPAKGELHDRAALRAVLWGGWVSVFWG